MADAIATLGISGALGGCGVDQGLYDAALKDRDQQKQKLAEAQAATDAEKAQHKKDVKGTVVTCETAVGPREGGGFGIAVKMHVKVPTLDKAEAEALVKETHETVCPYSHATRGNVDVVVHVEGK